MGVSEPKAPALEGDDLGMVEEPVEDDRGAWHITEELAPVFKRTVAGHDGASELMPPHDDLEEVFAAVLGQLLHAHGIEMVGTSLQFNFREEAHSDLDLIDEFAAALSLHQWERTRTHWAIKDGEIPAEMRKQMILGPYRQFQYEVVLSYAGEDHAYVERVASFLKDRDVALFFSPFREADLWGKELTEDLDIIYRREGRYCVTFLSEHYARKAWPTHERRSAMSRAVQEQDRYILPCRFDNTEMPGLRPSISYVDLNSKSPEQLGELIIQVLRRRRA